MADEVLILIPARMASTRLPGKPLADIAGLPMIVQVLRRAEEAKLGPVVVASDDETIATAVEKAGGRAHHDAGRPPLRLRPHLRGARRGRPERPRPDRRQRAGRPADASRPPTSPRRSAPLDDPRSTSRRSPPKSKSRTSATNPNVVKVVGSPVSPGRLRALYFTRATAPSGDGPLYHHIGLYAYRRAALERFVKLPPSPLEQRERLEQLRALEAGMRIDVAIVDTVPLGVDTPEDLETARAMLR